MGKKIIVEGGTVMERSLSSSYLFSVYKAIVGARDEGYRTIISLKNKLTEEEEADLFYWTDSLRSVAKNGHSTITFTVVE